MDVKGKRKYGIKKYKKRSIEKSIRSSPTINELPKCEGIENLYLSPLTQQILECRIGVNITLLEPWIFVQKEKILENIELHENSSEFLPLKDEIQSYPDDKILIGCYGHEQDVPEEFMVCITPDSAQHTLNVLVAREAENHRKIAESIERVCRTWTSLGSETEVDENMRLTLRKPYVVHLISEGNSFAVPCKFNFRFVDDLPTGYVELLSPRQIFRNVFRKRISFYVQCSALKTNAITQTIIEPVINKTTMCPIHMEPKKLEKGAIESFLANLNEPLLFDVLQTNFFMDLCNEDYIFQNALHMQLFKFPSCILSFQDIFTVRGKKVSCVSWNALKSGLIAASYMKLPGSIIVSKDIPHNPTDTIMEDHLILVWSYTDTIRPHLYLHCFREVTVVSFCTYNANIVVGGCDNGQIVVWDISGRIERGEILKVLTRRQQNHRLMLEKYMSWMKKPPGVQHVYPVIYSNIDVINSSPVSYIEWLPPNQFITRNGHFEMCKSNDVHMQFLSCSKEGGCIEIWDIGVPEDATVETKKKRIIRLNKVPSALRKYVSPLKSLAKNFIPVFRILISNPDTRKPLIISKLHEKNSKINYKPLNPETEENIYKRTLFEYIPNDTNETISEQKFTCATVFGEILNIQWEGHDYNQGCLVNSNAAVVSRTMTYHDGPVVVCMESPIIKDLLLTVGGRVFALWNIRHLQAPLFWRKTSQRYVTGTWLTTQPFQFKLIRFDTFKEIWDLMEDSKHALKIIRTKGRAVHSIYNDFTRMHTKKGTFVETNHAGEINTFSVDGSCKNIPQTEINAVVNYLVNLKLNTTVLMNWTNTIKSKFIVAEGEAAEEEAAAKSTLLSAKHEVTVDDPSTRKTKKSIHFEVNKWQAKEEAFMRQVLLANKHMKIDQIIENSDLIRQAEEMRKKNSKKFAEQVKNKEKNMQAWRTILIPEQEFIKYRQKITVSFSKDMARYMKQSYIQNYKDIEEPTLYYIRIHKYKYSYNWAELNKRAKASWSGHVINVRTKVVNPLDLKRPSRFLG